MTDLVPENPESSVEYGFDMLLEAFSQEADFVGKALTSYVMEDQPKGVDACLKRMVLIREMRDLLKRVQQGYLSPDDSEGMAQLALPEPEGMAEEAPVSI